MSFLYIVVRGRAGDLRRLRSVVGRSWLVASDDDVPSVIRYWVASRKEAEMECALLALAGFAAEIEGLPPAP